MIDNPTPALWQLQREAMQRDPYAIALQAEFARLYDAVGERRPAALGLCRNDGTVQYQTEPAEFWSERGE